MLSTILELITFPVRLLLGPPLRILEKRLALKSQREFEQLIRRDAGFLFTRHRAAVVANEGVPFPPPFDGAFVTLRAEDLLIRFEQGRGDFNVRIASSESPHRWTDLDVLISAVATPEEVRRIELRSVFRAGLALQAHWEGLKLALHSKKASEVILEFEAREEMHRKAAEKELNRRLYGN